MEGVHQLFIDLYQRFLLRDFVGKIVPGAVVAYSFCSMFIDTQTLTSKLLRVRWPVVVLLCGLTWTIALGLQSVAEFCGIWGYFPNDHNEIQFLDRTLRVEQFLLVASDGQKLQYERFVVIKEACGNLYVACIFSLVPWLFIFVWRTYSSFAGRSVARLIRRSILAAGVAVVLCGMYRMHWQHVARQWNFANAIVARKDLQAKPATSGGGQDSSPSVGQSSPKLHALPFKAISGVDHKGGRRT